MMKEVVGLNIKGKDGRGGLLIEAGFSLVVNGTL